MFSPFCMNAVFELLPLSKGIKQAGHGIHLKVKMRTEKGITE